LPADNDKIMSEFGPGSYDPGKVLRCSNIFMVTKRGY
jgi:hypothetical protein